MTLRFITFAKMVVTVYLGILRQLKLEQFCGPRQMQITLDLMINHIESSQNLSHKRKSCQVLVTHLRFDAGEVARDASPFKLYAARLAVSESSKLTISSIDQTWLEIPASIAGVTRNV